jgi:hypothetical protein
MTKFRPGGPRRGTVSKRDQPELLDGSQHNGAGRHLWTNYTMFVRFQTRRDRLAVDLVQTQRVAGKIRQEYIAGLGAIFVDESGHATLEVRRLFWRRLMVRLGKLSNRVSADESAKIMGAVHSRIPMVTADEIEISREQRAAASRDFWKGQTDYCRDQLAENENLRVMVDQQIAELRAGLEVAEEKTAAAERALVEKTEPPEPLTRAQLLALIPKAVRRRIARVGRRTRTEAQTQAYLNRRIGKAPRSSDGRFTSDPPDLSET